MTIETCQVKRFVEAFSGRCTERSILNRFITLGDFFPPILPSKRRRKRREPNQWSIPRGGRRRPWRLRREKRQGEGPSHRPVNKTSIDTRKMLWKWDATGGRGGKKGNRETDRGGRRGWTERGEGKSIGCRFSKEK